MRLAALRALLAIAGHPTPLVHPRPSCDPKPNSAPPARVITAAPGTDRAVTATYITK